MKWIVMMILLSLSFSALATKRKYCPYILPDGMTEQGGGTYYVLLKNQTVEVWHNPYQEFVEFIKMRNSGILYFPKNPNMRTYSCDLE